MLIEIGNFSLLILSLRKHNKHERNGMSAKKKFSTTYVSATSIRVGRKIFFLEFHNESLVSLLWVQTEDYMQNLRSLRPLRTELNEVEVYVLRHSSKT